MKRISLFIIVILFLYPGFSQVVERENGVYKFIENKGQWPEKVLFKSTTNFGNIWLEKYGVFYQFLDMSELQHASHNHKLSDQPQKIKSYFLYLQFIGANNNPEISTKQKSKEYYNFFLGNDREKWASSCYAYHDITYHKLYPGIDARIYEQKNYLKYEFKVEPNADPSIIQLKYNGYQKIKKDRQGNILIQTEAGEILEEKPYAYQIKNGKIIEVTCEFGLIDGIIQFELGEYDKDLSLIIDPILEFATYCGSLSDNFGMTATYAYDGKAYSGGTVYGNVYPTPALVWNSTSNISVQNVANSATTDVFISKYSSDGTTMLWTNFVGGGDDVQGTETVHSLICDKSNNIYLYGATASTDFPMMNAYQNTHGGGTALSIVFNGTLFGNQGTDIFVTKISSDGMSLLGSTYIGGSGNDGVNYKLSSGTYNSIAAYDSLTTNYGDQFRGEIMLDSFNNIIVTSSTRSTDFPVSNGFQMLNGGQQDGVVFKLASSFSTMLWSSYYGGNENDACYSVKIDSSYNILIAGGTSSNNLPNSVGGLNPNYQGGKTDGFVAKISNDGSTVMQTSYIGTPTYDQTIFVEIDRWDNVYIIGQTNGTMPVQNATYSNLNGKQFIMKLTPDLTSIVYSTVFGSGGVAPDISPAAFLVDICGNVYVSGWGGNILPGGTAMNNMPVSGNAFQNSPPNGFDFYLFVMERDAQSLLYGSYLGGGQANEHVDGGTSRFDKNGIVYQSVCGGCGGFSDFPTTAGAWSSTNNSANTNCNNLLFKFNFEIVPSANFTASSILGCAPLQVQFNNTSTDALNSVWGFDNTVTIVQGGPNPIVNFDTPGDYNISLTITDTICGITDVEEQTITVLARPELEVLTNDTLICDGNVNPIDLIANGFGTVTDFIWADNINFTNPINNGGLDSVVTVSPNTSTTYYIKVSNGNLACDLIDSVVVQLSSSAINLMPDTEFCIGDTIRIVAQISDGVFVTWEPADDIVFESPNQSYIDVVPGQAQYFYIQASVNGCIITDSVWVEGYELNMDELEALAEPQKIAEGGTSVLSGFPINNQYNYQWTPQDLVNEPNSSTTLTTNLYEDTNFELEITNGVCIGNATVLVEVLEFVCGDVYVFVPNAFSPNGDGNNEKVFVRGQNIEEITFKVFHRWGEMVFETNDPEMGWDGTFNDEPLDPDVYVFHLKVTCVDGQQNLIKGNITLLK